MADPGLTMEVDVTLDRKGIELLGKIGTLAVALKNRKLIRLLLSLSKHFEVVELSRERRDARRGVRRDRIGRKLKDRRRG